jgi:hypothetical protein
MFAIYGCYAIGAARAADGRPPYVGYITADNVDARSGPGDEYYATMRLSRRDRVEVYRHDPGGWFAVRPPQHSFSWVSGEFVRRTGDTGEVIGDRVIVRVGSQLDNTRDVIQMRLNRGETVQILGSKEFDDGAGPRVWYQIAPPPGEFRWVHGRYVSSQPLEPEHAAPQHDRHEHADWDHADPDHAQSDHAETDRDAERSRSEVDDEPLREADERRRHSRDDEDYADERDERDTDERDDREADAEHEDSRRAKRRSNQAGDDVADAADDPQTPTVRVSRRRPADEADADDYESVDGRERGSDLDSDSEAAYDPDSRAARRERARRDRLRAAAAAEAAEARLEAERDRADPNRAERERSGDALDREPTDRARGGDRRSRSAEAGDADHERDAADRDEASEEGTWRTRGGRRRDSDQSADLRPGASTDERFQAEIDELDLELSAMVAQEASEWNFTNLRARGEAMLTRGQTALERGRVRRVLTKLERFADIKERLDSAANIAADTQRLNAPLAAAASQSRGPHMRPEFDGTGRLARVQSDRAGVPAFALTDTSGAVRYYVTPSPGTNLQHYVGQEVGINGTLGFLPELNTQHVTARRVESITGDRTLMR